MDSDLILAQQLQEEVNREEFKKQHEKLSSNSSTSYNSIVSPQWEINDPNPDIYNLFQVFNAKFFWDKLGCVEVKWSSRMYSCAGTTTYKGMRGCIVTLSLPLLKLRPRKDLIETLLHEMIHAYLFVADRDREREEHGPKFHSHMHRINKAAGTKITVYHSFHDEVKHYKNHWWRCNGPCQFKHPYFGLVKRSMNRAPGPNDFWFGEHRLNCGGEFIKIKEPEGFKSRKSKKVQAEKENSGNQQNLDTLTPKPFKSKSTFKTGTMNKLNGIENNKSTVEKFSKTSNVHGFKGLTSSGKQQSLDKFLSPYKPKSTSNFNTMNKLNDKIKNSKASVEKIGEANNINGFKDKELTKHSGKQQNLDKFLSPPQASKSNGTSNIANVNKLNGIDNSKATVEKFGKTNNVHGFKGLTPASSKTNTSGIGRSFGNNGGTALLSNRSGTLVERPKPGPSTSCANSRTDKISQQTSVSPKKPIPSITNTTQAFSGRGQVLNPNCKPNEINRANSTLLKLFPESNSSNNVENIPTKKPKLEVAGSISLLDESQNETLVNCPVCNCQLPEEAVNYHLDECINLEAIMKNICETVIIEDDDDDDLDEETVEEFTSENVNCPVCGHKCSTETINQHLDECLQNA